MVAVDLLDEKLERARRYGADHMVNASKEDPSKYIQDLGGADVAPLRSPRSRLG